MKKYHTHSLALNDQEQADFEEVKARTGFGAKKIFMAMIEALKQVQATPEPAIAVEEN